MGVRPSILLSLVASPAAFYVSLVGGYSGVPVIASTGGYRDTAAETMNPYYVSIDPDAEDLALAASALLLGAPNGTVYLLRDAHSPFYSAFGRALRRIHIVKELTIEAEDGPLLLDRILAEKVQVLLLACGRSLAERVLGEANRLHDDGKWTWILVEGAFTPNSSRLVIPGSMGLRLRPGARPSVRTAVKLAASALYQSHLRYNHSIATPPSCWFPPDLFQKRFSEQVHRLAMTERRLHISEDAVFDVYLFRDGWVRIGNVSAGNLSPSAIPWSDSPRFPTQTAMPRYRVVTARAPPFVLPATEMENGSCLTGMPCLQVGTHSKSRLVRLIADFTTATGVLEGSEYNVTCCAGIAIDLLRSLSADLRFEVDLYLVGDGLFGSKRGNEWNGMVRDLISGSAHMALSALSTSSERSREIDYSVPFQQSGVSCLAYTQPDGAVPLTAFLVPFSAQLWLAIFASLNTTALVSAVYEWLSPFGLNPRGRGRSRNFSLASALWVMWSLLFSHLVAFKAPKSWPNKVLINLWGCFSVIFVSSYTANIAAHFAGLMLVRDRVDHLHDATLLNQRTGTVKASSAESYIRAQNPRLWQHIQRYGSSTLDEALEKLRRGDLDVFIGDTPLLDYVRGEDCNLRLLGQSIFEDAYAIGMRKGSPLKDSISTMLLRYSELGLTERLRTRWAGRQPCFGIGDGFGLWGKARPLSPSAVAGVFVALFGGICTGLLILLLEHIVFRYAIPKLRKTPKGIWKSPNLMFFSQKLYRFINTVELVSPHHSAKEIASNLRHGQVFRLFQKSMKKMHKEVRKKKGPQIYDILQEIRKAIVHNEDQDISVPTKKSSPPPNMMGRRSLSLGDIRANVQPPQIKRRASSMDGDLRSEKVLVDDLILRAMTKEDIIRCWQTSERRLLHLLDKAIRANISLERKLYCIQRTLVSSKSEIRYM